MPKIFISYRRDADAYVAQQISTTLKKRFGDDAVFFDTSGIEFAADWQKTLADELEQTDMLLAIIGDRWLNARFADGSRMGQRRLDDPTDVVRFEIATALMRGIPVLPVMIEKVAIPALASSLPPDLASLTKLNGIEVRAGRDLENDLKSLVRGLRRVLLPPLTASEMALPPGVKVVPKGLRSFDENDADFFAYLLPGPYEDDGLPKSLSLWKNRIEAKAEGTAFRVGVIYGPSGCGKSSLIKAGLLPRLTKHITPVFVEARATDTRTEVLAALSQHCPYLPGFSSLQDALSQKDRIPDGTKVLVVLDQFEQYLHSTPDDDQEDLAEALRECDGRRLQCILMIRDDFVTPISRFMGRLKVPLAENDNFALVDLFTKRHAKKVLALLGQAYGGLPPLSHGAEFSRSQNEFLNQAISELAGGDYVTPVRLAVFAQMCGGKKWEPATLKAVGGATGVGVAFLEDSFAARPRREQQAAQRVLRALLPDPDTTIKGAMRTKQELLELSGYGDQRVEFDQLLAVLNNNLRLVTPTEPLAGVSERNPKQLVDADKRYQLTHDYLVPSLREWLTKKQRETREGRAELSLGECTILWNARKQNRPLPNFDEWIELLSHTQESTWTDPQRNMMREAGEHHVQSLRDRILAAHTPNMLAILEEMARYQDRIADLLRDAFQKDGASSDARTRLHASLALLPVDATQVDYLYDRLLDAAQHEVPVIRDALAPHKDQLLDKLWAVAESTDKRNDFRRLRAAAALAKYDPDNERWVQASTLVVDDLVLENSVYLGQWSEAFRPVKKWLLPPLSVIFRDRQPERAAERSLATSLLADYAADNPRVLADLLMDADDKQFAVVFPKFQEQFEEGSPVLVGEIDTKLPADIPSSDESREKLAKRQANAAVALLRLKQPDKVWPLLKHGPDPRVRSYLIHRLSPLGAEAGDVIKRLDEEPDATMRRALLLSLGEFGEKELSFEARAALVPKLEETYRTAADPGLHAASEWLLRTWKHEAWLRRVNDEWAKDKEPPAKRFDGIRQLIMQDEEKTPRWYVNGQGQTMIAIPGPVEFTMGSPRTEARRDNDETQHQRRIGRTFALAAKSVTVEQYRQFDKDYQLPEQYTRLSDLPVVGMLWYEAVKYCNWLSEQEGVDKDQLCYEIKGDDITLRANYLSLPGYRLPTEAEIEFATRAGSVTSRYFGETDELLAKYAWYNRNSEEQTWPVGSLKPNDWGFFDVQGNVWTWCGENDNGYPQGKGTSDDVEGGLVVNSTCSRVLRGGSFTSRASNVRSAYRITYLPTYRLSGCGFRVARTLPLIPLTPLPPAP